jgi:DNA-binding MarR family transcriptional regulator
MDKENVLQELGFTKNESKVYLSLLYLGCCSAGKIAEHCKMHRTNVYDSLERLRDKGMVSVITQNETKMFEAAEPANLANLLEEKKARLNSVLPQLLLDKQLASKASASVHEGLTAFKMILYSLLEYNEPILVFGIPAIVPDLVKSWINHFHAKRAAKKIKMLHIYNENAKERIEFLNTQPYTEARYLPHQLDSCVTTQICGNEVDIIHWLSEPITIVQIKNKPFADAYKKYFEVLYKTAKSKTAEQKPQ